jgi:hypothetical protein
MTATPDSVSVPKRVTVTSAEYVLVEHVEPLQLIEEAGAVVSTWMNRDFVASTLPAVSQALYLTVEVVDTVNGTVYAGLAAVGSEPSVV